MENKRLGTKRLTSLISLMGGLILASFLLLAPNNAAVSLKITAQTTAEWPNILLINPVREKSLQATEVAPEGAAFSNGVNDGATMILPN